MATTYYAQSWYEGKPAKHEGLTVATGYYNLTGALDVNDVIKLHQLPINACLQDFILSAPDLDTGGTPAITITARASDGTTTKAAFTGSTVGQASGIQRMDDDVFHGYVLGNDNFYMELLIAAGPTTGATTGQLRWVLTYTMDIPGARRTE